MQSAAPISVLLDNLAVPCKARIRSICFPRSGSPGVGMRLDGFPGCTLAATAAVSLCCCSSERDRQSKNCRQATWQWGTRTAPFWPGRHYSGPQDACGEQVSSVERLSEKDMRMVTCMYRARGWWNGVAGSPPVSLKCW